VDSITAPLSSGSSPTDLRPPRSEKLLRVAALTDAARRQEAARELASFLGADDLLVFSPDPELDILLPAPGFPQTLPAGLSWQTLLRECISLGQTAGRLRCPYSGREKTALALAGADGSVLVLLGGTPRQEEVAEVQTLLPLLSAAFRGERIALTAAGHARVAEEAADRAEALAESLDVLRRELGAALTKANAAAAENARLYDEVREADRRKDEFLAMLAHELRNPLAPVRNALQIMKSFKGDEVVLEQARQMAERQVHHLTRLVDDLMDVSRITRGKIRLRKRSVELATVLAGAVETSRPLIEARRHELTVALPSEIVRLDADPTRLGQVLTNLLNNAAKYTDEGGKIELTARREGGEVAIAIRDNGVGIPAEMLPKVFDLFTQVDRSLDRAQGGLGIGLTLVRRLVEMHDGSVRAFSSGPGRGSEFVVRLPIAEEMPALAPADSGEEDKISVGPPRRRILVVDDNVDAARSLAWLLQYLGQEVYLAHDGVTALEAARAHVPEIVLLDIGLPRIDGYEVARRLRRDESLEGVLLVAMTGYGQEEDRRRAYEAGFDRHLIKPIDPDGLAELLSLPVGFAS
jgi:signal transduction histidine kinase/CheY-like chemotaxis protein